MNSFIYGGNPNIFKELAANTQTTTKAIWPDVLEKRATNCFHRIEHILIRGRGVYKPKIYVVTEISSRIIILSSQALKNNTL